jgi:hypothetical protein
MKAVVVLCLLVLLIVIIFLMIRSCEGFSTYQGVGRWDSKIYPPWEGTKMYPVSINCNCPDNYDFIDNNCVNRNYPNDISKPFCYDSLE